MGITYDVVPVLGAETTDNAVGRIWGGDPRLDDPPDPEPADPVLQAAWRAQVLARLLTLDGWSHEAEGSTDFLWHPDYDWQVEVNERDLTLRYRGGGADEQLDAHLLAMFRELDCVLVYPDADGWVRLREAPELDHI
jgi:hypothetical protein